MRSHPEVLWKRAAIKVLWKFTGKHLWRSFIFVKLWLKARNFTKVALCHGDPFENLHNIFRKTFLQSICKQLLSKYVDQFPLTLIKLGFLKLVFGPSPSHRGRFRARDTHRENKSTDIWKMWFIKLTVKMNGCYFQQVLRQNLSWFLF